MLSGVSPTLQTGLCYAGECIDTLNEYDYSVQVEYYT